MATLDDVKSRNWQMSLYKPGEIVQGLADVKQCIYVVLTTVKGSDPLRPDFGCGIFEYLDRPINFVVANMRRDILDAVNRYEPRVEIIRILHTVEDSHLTVSVEWTLNGAFGETIVSYDAS